MKGKSERERTKKTKTPNKPQKIEQYATNIFKRLLDQKNWSRVKKISKHVAWCGSDMLDVTFYNPENSTEGK